MSDWKKALIAHLKGFLVPFEAFFEDIRQRNQLHFIAVLRFLVDVPAIAGWKQILLVIKACRWIMAVRGPEFLNVHGHIDKLLFRTGDCHEGLVGDRLRLGPAPL